MSRTPVSSALRSTRRLDGVVCEGYYWAIFVLFDAENLVRTWPMMNSELWLMNSIMMVMEKVRMIYFSSHGCCLLVVDDVSVELFNFFYWFTDGESLHDCSIHSWLLWNQTAVSLGRPRAPRRFLHSWWISTVGATGKPQPVLCSWYFSQCNKWY